MEIMQGKDITVLAGFIMICLAAGGIGSLFTMQSIPTWYAGLNKPDFSPPNWVFGPVWTTLYILMGIAAYLVYAKGMKKKEIRGALMIFGGQLVLNTLWSILFFGLHSPLYGFVCIIALWLAIAATIWKFYGVSKNAGLLLVPYILWVSFASVLNLFIWMMN
ncbi:tryptophan-rich sensory protein [Candidatus Micrarchaeota archaeon]|nr:tryptophan-rich sensory protein [Candidatus Micrarchaeota archaeon]